MITIKYIWFYAVVLVASVGGFGAGYMVPHSDEDLAQQLRQANEQIESIAVTCAKEKEAFKRVPIVDSPSRGF